MAFRGNHDNQNLFINSATQSYAEGLEHFRPTVDQWLCDDTMVCPLSSIFVLTH